MWAQLITMRVKQDRQDDVPGVLAQVHAAEQAHSGLVRTTTMQDQNDPTRWHILVVFESQEKARAREQDPRRREAVAAVNAQMADLLDGPPEFVDLAVVEDA